MRLKNLGNSLNAIKDIKGIFDVGFNVGEFEALRQATSGYSKEVLVAAINQKAFTAEQAQAILAAKGVEAAEAEQIITTAGLTASQTAAATSINLRTMSTIGNTAATTAQITEETKNLLLTGGLITEEQLLAGATVQVTAAKIADAVASGTLTTAEGALLISTFGLSGATSGLSLAMKGLGVAIKANPLFWALGIAAGVYAVVKAVDYFTISAEEARQTAKDSAQAYSDMISEIDSLNSELKTTAQRIDELNGKENISLVEQDELNSLKEHNSELERELDIKQRLAEVANRQANDDAKAALSHSGKYGYDNGTESVSVQGNQIDATMLQVEHYQVLQDAMKHSKEQMDALIKDDPKNYIKNEAYRDLAYSYDWLIYQSDELEKTISDNITTFMTLDDSLSSTDEESKVLIDSLSLLYNAFDKVFLGVGQSSEDKINDILSRPTLEKTKETLVELGKQGSLSVDTLNSRYSGLISILDEAGVSAKDLYHYILAIADSNSINLHAVRKSLYDQYVTPNIGTDDTDFNRITSEYYGWLDGKSDGDLEIIYSIKSSSDTSGWSFEDFDLEIKKRKSSDLDVSLSYSDTIAELDKMNDAFSVLGKTYDKFKDKDKDIDFSDLSSIIEKFKDVSGIENYVKAIQDAKGNAEATQIAFDNLSNAYLAQTGILNQVNDGNAELISNYLTEQGVINASEMVAAALASKHAEAAWASRDLSNATAEEIEALALETEATDSAKEAFGIYIVQKMLAEAAINTSGDISALANVVSSLGLATSAWRRYYAVKAQLAVTDAAIKSGEKVPTPHGWGGELSTEDYKKQLKEDESNSLKSYAEDLERRAQKTPSYGHSVNTNKSGGSQNGPTAKNETEKEINWIDRKMQLLEGKRKELLDKAASAYIPYLGTDEQSSKQLRDYFEKIDAGIALTNDEFTNLSFIADKVGISVSNIINEMKNGGAESRKGYMAQALEVDKKILEECSSDVEYYNSLYDEAASKLSDELRDKVENGGDAIQTLYGEEAKNVDNAISARDKKTEALQREAAAKKQFSEDAKTYAEMELDYLDKQADSVEHRNNMIQKQIDYLNASGNVVNGTAYEALIVNLQQQETILNKKLALQKKELQRLLTSGEIKEGDERYFEIQAYIESCEESLADLAIQQEEYNDKIRQLPIENMQKILNMYEDIANALQDYADMVEASGKKLDAEYYQTQIKNGIKTISQYKEQADLIRDVMDEYEVGSDKYMDMYDKLQDVNSSISNIVKNMHEWNKELLALPINAINDQLTGLNEALNSFQDIQSDHETVINAVTDAINEQIDALEEQRDIETEAVQNEIDALQEKLDLLQKQNDERKLQLALEQAKYDLERAQNQKSNQVVRDGELIWEANQDDIRSAGESVADAQYDILTHELEKQKEALKENLSLIEERYQKQIDQLTEMSEKWSKIKSDAEAAANAAIANQYLGEGWKDKVTSGNDKDIYEAFQNNFNTNHQMVSKYEKQIQSTEQIYNLLNSYITAYQAGTLSYEQAMASIKALLSQMNQDMSANQSLQNVLDYLGKVNGTNADADSVLAGIQAQLKADSDEMLKNLEQYNDNLALITECMTSWEQLTTNIGDIRNLMDDVIQVLEDGFRSFGDYVSELKNDLKDKDDEDDEDDGWHSSGTVSAGGASDSHYSGNNVNTSGSQDSNHGPGVKKYAKGIENGAVGSSISSAARISSEEFERLKEYSTRNLAEMKNGEVPVIAHQGEVIMNQNQQKTLLDNFSYLKQLPLMNLSTPVIPSAPSHETFVEINMGGITLTDVRDADGFAKAINQSLKLHMTQELSKNKYHF